MEDKQSKSKTLKISRVIRAPAERVYRAFLDPEAMVKWNPPHGFTGKITHMEAKEGGTYKMSFTNFSTGETHSFGGTYLELVPNKLIRYNDAFDDPNMSGTMEVSISFEENMGVTKVTIIQKNIPDQIPLEFATMGWQESLQLLEQLVIPEIPSNASQ